MAMRRKGTTRNLRGRNRMKATAIKTAARTIGDITLSPTPPPNRKFSVIVSKGVETVNGTGQESKSA
jgi:hypothetical protein